MKMFAIYKDEKLIIKKRFANLQSIKKYLQETNRFGQFTIIQYNLKEDHIIYRITNKKVAGKNEIL